MYRKFGGKGIERVCDGETCELTEEKGSDFVVSTVPCICQTRGKECKVNTRLEVLLAEVAMAGTWTFVTNSEQNADTIPAMVQAIEQAATRGYPLATLTVEEAQARGGSKKFILVRLAPVVSLQELMSGGGTLTAGALQQAAVPPVGELGQGAAYLDRVTRPVELTPEDAQAIIEDWPSNGVDLSDGPPDALVDLAAQAGPEDAMALPAIMARVKAHAPMKDAVRLMWEVSGIPPLSQIPEDRLEAITQLVIDEIDRNTEVICGCCGYRGILTTGPSDCFVCGDQIPY